MDYNYFSKKMNHREKLAYLSVLIYMLNIFLKYFVFSSKKALLFIAELLFYLFNASLSFSTIISTSGI